MADYDLAIIGGGINGTGLARDAAGRGLRVLLVEMNDLASGTSSASSQTHPRRLALSRARRLPPGARGAQRARSAAAHGAACHPAACGCLLPPRPGGRSPLLLRLGLFLYDMLGARRLLERSRAVDLTHHRLAGPLKRSFRYGFEFSDCMADDARLVVLNAVDAAERGADIRTRTKLTRAERGDGWTLVLQSRGRRHTATARVLVNAAGPWIGDVAETVIREPLALPAASAQGQPYRGAAPLRARRRLPAAGRRRPRGVRAAFRRRFHFDRHHRRELRRRPGRADADGARKFSICARRSTSISAKRSRPTTRSGPSPACARCTTTAPARPRT